MKRISPLTAELSAGKQVIPCWAINSTFKRSGLTDIQSQVEKTVWNLAFRAAWSLRYCIFKLSDCILMYFQMFFNYDDGDQMHINVNMHYI